MRIRIMSSFRQIRPYLVALTGVLALTLALQPLRSTLTIANITMTYLLLVVVIAVTQGTGPALVTALVSFFSINYFFVQPLYSMSIADPREVLDLFVFVVVGIIAGRLSAYTRQQAESARQRAIEQETMYRLTRTFNQLMTRDQVLEALAQAVQQDFSARQVDVLPDSPRMPAPDTLSHYLLLQTQEKVYCTLRASFDLPLTPDRVDLLSACAAQAAMALQRIELSEQARKSQRFEEADRLKTAILHAVSHDLRTPITIIKTSASNLSQLGERLSPEEQAEIAETIEYEADQLDKLVGNLLDMSRLEAGVIKLNKALNAFEEVAGEVAARAWVLYKKERVRLNFPEEMPLVAYDYGLFLQALSNLVDNSLRYEPPESQVELCGAVIGDKAILKVINHGETIPAEFKEKLMEPFYKGKEGHIGLGLAIAKGIIEAHRGSLHVEDTPGSGATFVIELPMKAAPGIPNSPERPDGPG